VTNYITGSRTRANFPPTSARWAGSVSDVELEPGAFLPAGRVRTAGSVELVTVGLLDVLYKGQDVLIRAVAQCRRAGADVRLTFVGDGQNRNFLLKLAGECGIDGLVRVTGALGGAGQVREYLSNSDVFVLPSKAEGIPRALIEAMAAGLPAICSPAGAMGDLVERRWLVAPGSVTELTARILEMIQARSEWSRIGLRNQEVARAFEGPVLGPQRLAFYRAIREHCLGQRGFSGAEPTKLEVTHAA
jgi:phosphatidyl-myo-inositol dimannoside synthase